MPFPYRILGCLLLIHCASAQPQGSELMVSSNLSDFQGSFCDAGNYGSLWTLLNWTDLENSSKRLVRIQLNTQESTLNAKLINPDGSSSLITLSYEYRAPYLWVQRHFEVSGWPEQYWVRLGVVEGSLVVLMPEEKLELPPRTHLRAPSISSCS